MKPSKSTTPGIEMKKGRKFGYQYYKASVSGRAATRRISVMAFINFASVLEHQNRKSAVLSNLQIAGSGANFPVLHGLPCRTEASKHREEVR